jgi:hypothetical protein
VRLQRPQHQRDELPEHRPLAAPVRSRHEEGDGGALARGVGFRRPPVPHPHQPLRRLPAAAGRLVEPQHKGRLFEPPFAHWRDTYLVNWNRTADFVPEYRAFSGTYVKPLPQAHPRGSRHDGARPCLRSRGGELRHPVRRLPLQLERLRRGRRRLPATPGRDQMPLQTRVLRRGCASLPQACDESQPCPPGAFCANTSSDGVARCFPGPEIESSSPARDEPARGVLARARGSHRRSAQGAVAQRRAARADGAGLVHETGAELLAPSAARSESVGFGGLVPPREAARSAKVALERLVERALQSDVAPRASHVAHSLGQ